MKQIIEVILEHDIKHSLDGTLAEAVEVLNEMIQRYGPDARLDIDKEFEPYSDYAYAYVRLYGKREETDAEYQKRIGEEQKNLARQLENERREFERLAKKFATNN